MFCKQVRQLNKPRLHALDLAARDKLRLEN